MLSVHPYVRVFLVGGCSEVEVPRARRGSNANASKPNSSAVFPSFMGMGGNSGIPLGSSLSGSVAIPAIDTTAGSNAALDLKSERPMTAAAVPSMTAGSSLGMAAGMAGMFGQTSARPSTAAVQAVAQSAGL